MSNLSTEFKVGLLILVGIAVIVYASVVVTGWRPGAADTYTVHVEFDNVAGLLPGSPVQVSGIKVGQVSGIALREGRAGVSMEIDREYRLYADATATIKSLGILGDKYVAVQPGTPTRPRLQDGDTIVHVIPGSDLDSLVESTADILRDVQSVTETLRRTLGGETGLTRINTLMDGLVTSSENLSRTTDVVDRRIDAITRNIETFSAALARMGEQNEESIAETTRNLEHMTEGLDRMVTDNEAAVQRTADNLETLTESLRRLTVENEEAISNAAGNLESLTANLDRMTGENEEEVQRTLDNLARFSEDLAAITRRNRESLDRIVSDLGTFSESLAADGPAITRNLRAVLEENRQALRRSMANLDGSLEDLREFTAENKESLGSVVDNLETTSDALARDGPAITGNLRGILEENRAELKTSVSNLDTTLDNLSVVSRDLRQLTRENRESLSSTLTNLDTFSESLATDGPAITSDLRGLLSENRRALKTSVDNLNLSLEKMDDTMANLERVTGRIDRGEGSLGKLVNDETTVDELNDALAGVNRYLRDLNRIKLDIGGRTEYLGKQGEYKSYLTLKLQPLKNRYYLLELVDNPRGDVEEKTIEETTTTGGVTTRRRTKRVVTDEELQLSLLVAQRYYDTELRGGLMENSFGLGVHQIFGRQDQYRIGLDVWDFGNDLGPHAKATGYWRFFSNAFVVVGYDDFLSEREELRDAFFGVGLTFNEDSLKPLVSSLPVGTVSGQ